MNRSTDGATLSSQFIDRPAPPCAPGQKCTNAEIGAEIASPLQCQKLGTSLYTPPPTTSTDTVAKAGGAMQGTNGRSVNCTMDPGETRALNEEKDPFSLNGASWRGGANGVAGVCRVSNPSGGLVDVRPSRHGKSHSLEGVLWAGEAAGAGVDVYSLYHDAISWSGDGGTWDGPVRITWWVEEVEHGVAGGTHSGKRVSSEHTAEGPVRVEVSARVPALVLPETVLVSMDAGKKNIRSPARFKGSVSGAGKRY